jgi:hypothetical protein
LPGTLPDTLRPPSMALVRLQGRPRRRDCGSLVAGPVWVMLMSYCLVTRSPKSYPEVRLLARECSRQRCCLCRRGSYHRLFRCRRNPDCWGRWDRCRARPAPMLESRNWRSRTGRPAPRPTCSGRLSVRRCYATRNRQRAPAPPLPASTLCFPSCGAFYPTAHADDTLKSRRMMFPLRGARLRSESELTSNAIRKGTDLLRSAHSTTNEY